MRVDPEHLAYARRVADAVLYEGYLLYPYRASAQKNQARFQFGVLVPPAYGAADASERTASQTECLAECADEAEVEVLLRFLQLVPRTVQEVPADGGELRAVGVLNVGGDEHRPWDEAEEREQYAAASVAELLRGDKSLEFHIGAGETSEDITDAAGRVAGRLVRRWAALNGVIELQAERTAGPYGALRLRVRVENRTAPAVAPDTRNGALGHSLIAAHVLIAVPGGKFLSLTDPPEWAAAEVAACANVGTWPVLTGPEDCKDLVLSAPVILYDHPEIAAESAGDLFDATEIDEILTLRTLALTDSEKRDARATDPRVAELIDRLDGMPPEMIERLHGAIRYLGPAVRGMGPAAGGIGSVVGDIGPVIGGVGPVVGGVGSAARDMPLAVKDVRPAAGDVRSTASGIWSAAAGAPEAGGVAFESDVPWWDPGSDASVSPETDHVVIDGVPLARGSKVILRPGAGRGGAGGSRRADAQDLFLAGRTALVEAVLNDVDGQVHVAVILDDDPAPDLRRDQGRFLYFAPDELEPIETAPRRKS
jgi:hypothetical protein